MHIPDGFLSGEAAAVGWVVGGSGIALCMREVGLDDNERKLPVAGLAAAFFLVAGDERRGGWPWLMRRMSWWLVAALAAHRSPLRLRTPASA